MFLATSSDFDGRDRRLLPSYSPKWDRRKRIDRTGVPERGSRMAALKASPRTEPREVHEQVRRSRPVNIEISKRGVVLAQSNTRAQQEIVSDEFTGDV